MGLLNKKNIKDIKSGNKYKITKKDMKGELKGFPLGVVVRMLEETEKQGNKPDVKVFQHYHVASCNDGGFDWSITETGYDFWSVIIREKDFNEFYSKYSEYKKYER